MKKTVLLFFLTLVSATVLADERRFSVPLGDSPSLGPAKAPVTIIEFLDFQ